MKKILVPTDFSSVSRNAVDFSLDLAEKTQGEITLFHSIYLNYFYDFQYGDFGAINAMTEEIKEDVEKRMKDFIEELDTQVKVDYIILPDSIVLASKELVEKEGFDLMVVGTHGSSGLEEVFIGSNAEKLVRHSPCPVITVPKGANLNSVEKVLVPIDLTELRGAFLTRIANLQSMFECELEFIWIRQSEMSPADEKALGDELAEIFSSYKLDNYRFFVLNNINPEDGIFLEAKDAKADMVAMATHARRGIAHWLSGSLTEDTINHLDIPVWTFKIEKSEKPIRLNAKL